MPKLIVDWPKMNEENTVPTMVDKPSVEGGVVLHAMHLPNGQKGDTFCAPVSVALAEVNMIQKSRYRAYVDGPDGSPGVLAMVPVTRLFFRSGDSVILVHPFDDIEPIFIGYRRQRDFPLPPGPQAEPRFLVYGQSTNPRLYVLAIVHDEVVLTAVRAEAQRFSFNEANEIKTKFSRGQDEQYLLEPA